MKAQKRAIQRFILFHICVGACAALFPLFRFAVGLLPSNLTGCILHDWVFLYCPLCGGTRALADLLRFDLLQAVRDNAFVALVALVAVVHYVVAWVRLLRGQATLFRFLAWEWIAFGALLIAFGILRNVLMIRFGIDALGDLGAFWNGIRLTCLY